MIAQTREAGIVRGGRVCAARLLHIFAAVCWRDEVDLWNFAGIIAEWHEDTKTQSRVVVVTEKHSGTALETLRRWGLWGL